MSKTDNSVKSEKRFYAKFLPGIGFFLAILIVTGSVAFASFFPKITEGNSDPHIERLAEIEDRGAAENSCEMPEDVIDTAFGLEKENDNENESSSLADGFLAYYIGAICRWIYTGDRSLQVSYAWFEKGSLERERKVNQYLHFNVTDTKFRGLPALTIVTSDGCGLIINNPDQVRGGVVQFWVQGIAGDENHTKACRYTQKLMRVRYGDID